MQASAPRWENGLPVTTSSGVPITDSHSQPFAAITIRDCVFKQANSAHRAVEIYGSVGVMIAGSRVEVLAPAEVEEHKQRRLAAVAVEGSISGSFDGFSYLSASLFKVHGWVVDRSFDDDTHSSAIDIYIDGSKVFSAVADFPRPDLVPGLTNHSKKGFETTLPEDVGKLVASGNHTIMVEVQRKAPLPPWQIHQNGKSPYVCINKLRRECTFPQDCTCGAALPPRIFISNSLNCTQQNNLCDGGKPCTVGGGSACDSTAAALVNHHNAPPVWSFWGGNYGCGGDVNCVNCTSAEAQLKCAGHEAIFLSIYATNITCSRTPPPTSLPPPPASFRGDFSCCNQLVGPTTYNVTNCFFCRGETDCVPSSSSSRTVSVPSPNLKRSISWWFDVAENVTVDALNVAAIKEHRALFSRVMPYNARVELDGNVSRWWGNDAAVAAWNAPLQALNVSVLPYLIDIDNSTQMHMVYANSSAVVADAVQIALHYGFQGWFIDYEDEYPPDTDPHKSAKLAAFLTELGDALHAEGMELTICVASWSALLADYRTIAASSGVDELQLMSTYARPSNYESIVSTFFTEVKSGAGDLRKAGVGVGVYYDGRNGYANDWTEASARAFLTYVAKEGGSAIDIFRLLKDGAGKDDWPHAEWWWTVLEEFMTS